MAFNTFSLFYIGIVLILFYLINPSARRFLLFTAGLCYSFICDRYAGIAVTVTVMTVYMASRIIGYLQARKLRIPAAAVTVISIALCICSLAVFKFSARILSLIGSKDALGIIIPIGFSYHIFEAVSYLYDVYSGGTDVQKSFVDLGLYFTWFPKFISGPIEREGGFAVQIRNLRNVHLNDPIRWYNAFTLIVFGCFYKMLIADRLKGVTDTLFAIPDAYGSIWLILGSLAYTIRIYCDFAGYSMMAAGVSLLFGIRLVTNFDSPYCSRNITEFWRRWHMSLSSFLKDYLYIPLGGNRLGNRRKIINTMIVFAICGLWHGNGFNFLFWGLLHGIYSAVDSVLREHGIKKFRTGMTGRIITFVEVSFAWVFFRASSFTGGLKYILYIFTNGPCTDAFNDQLETLIRYPVIRWVILISIILMIIFDVIQYRSGTSISAVTASLPLPAGLSVCMLLLIAIVIFGNYGPDTNNTMIYMNF